MKTGEDRLLRYLEIGGFLYTLMLILISWKWASYPITFGIFIGGFIALVNFRAWQWFGKKLIRIGSTKKTWVFGQMVSKTLLPFVLIALAIWVLKVNPIGLALGLSAVVVAILGYAIWLIWKSLILKEDKES